MMIKTILLHFDIDDAGAIADLEKTKKIIIGLKKEQADLNKAYKAGTITVEEYASESVRVEAILKKQNATYNTNQKAITGVKTKMDELIDSNKKLAEETGNAVKSINVAGVSVGDLSTKIASFANPATAAIGIVSALGAAYARSSIGAKDLEFASNQLSFATDLLTDKFARLFSSVEDGQGFFSKLTDSFIAYVDLEAAVLSNLAAQAQEDLNTIREESGLAQAAINERLAKNADLMEDVANTELTILERTQAAQIIKDNITTNAGELLALKNKEIDAENKILLIRKAAGGDTGDNEFRINKLIQERSAITVNESRQLTKIDKQLNAINNAEAKRLDALQKQKLNLQEQEQLLKDRQSFAEAEAEAAKKQSEREANIGTRQLGQLGTDPKKVELKAVQQTEKQKQEAYLQSSQLKMMLDEETANNAIEQINRSAADALVAFGEQSALFKFLASAETLISTYSSAQKSYDALAGIPYVGPALGAAAAGLAITAGLARVAAINGVDIAAAGGADFITKKPTMLLVGDNPGGRERVTVEPLSGKGQTRVFNGGRGVAMAGGGSLTVNDGGFVANTNMQASQQAMIMANAFKNMPAPVVGVTEITRVQKRIQAKEKVTRQ